MDLQLRGKKVLITGASQGIGEGLADVFAEEGCNLILVARSGDKLARLAGRLRDAHGVEIATLLPLVLLLGDRWGATGAAAAVLIATAAFAGAWSVLLYRLRREHHGKLTTTEALQP